MYRLKHKPTGLYYQPHSQSGSDLGIRGKVYQTGRHGLSEAFKHPESIFKIYIKKDSSIYKKTKDILEYKDNRYDNSEVVEITCTSDWEIENI